MYGLSQTTAPTEDPLTLDEAKLRLGLPLGVGLLDEMMRSQIKAATKLIEDRTNRQFCTASWTLVLDCLPLCRKLPLPRAPLRSVTTFTYLDSAGASTVWASSNYRVATTKEPGEVSLAYGVPFPTTYPVDNAISIVYSAGYGAKAAVPELAKQAITAKLGEWWAKDERDARQFAQSCESLITSLSYGDDFVQYDTKEAVA